MVTLSTNRLLLRPLEIADADQAQQLFPHWEIVQFLNTKIPWPFPTDGALTYYRDVAIPAMNRGEEWHWTLRLRESPDQLIGAIDLISKFRGDPACASRGFWLALPWHGRGLMTEAVIAVNDYCFDVLHFPCLRVPKAIANVPSRRISEKTGMRVVATEQQDFIAGTLPSEIWELTAEEWRKQRTCQTRLSQ
jgi:[ribosomal protein S5]-alanine N-acetyltransferase